ncbi:HAD hydrolase-like protein [Dictyobacter arantiisoli]|uniref:Haloacid dehalogenase n=1 Tax=Dictyobacter arantiisoli TaxID=2014874 RepID=A0A5A5TB36_9CHLR|nr:HAD hydrolase-like protein [Dictyobacter arantiisoli]GCF08710.1 haloacid dehalogenase [Dictyobacter arantiisoli]
MSQNTHISYTLFIDADDTLWENNIYFEQATSNFIQFLRHSTLSPQEVEAVINEIQHQLGYGFQKFTESLIATYRQLSERPIQDEDIEQIRTFGTQLANHPMEVLDGVEQTLRDLSHRHTLVLVTKGHAEEQQLKVERSSLADYFEHIIVLPEKHPEAYQQLLQQLHLDATTTWMIGNSPHSDINASRQAGLNTVFIPHAHTWRAELTALWLDGPGKHLVLQKFAELSEHF